MKKFKRGTALGLVVALSLSLCSCGKGADLKLNKTEISTVTEDTTSAATTEDIKASFDPKDVEAEQARFDEWCMDQFKESVNGDSISLNYTLANPEAYGIVPVKATFGDADTSLEGEEKSKKEDEDTLDELVGFNYDMLTEEQQYTYDVLNGYLEDSIALADYHYYGEPFAYTSGLQTNIPITLAEYTFYDRQDIDDYIELLNQVDDYFASFLEFEREKSKEGFFMSETSASEVIRQSEEFIANPEDNLLIATFDSRIEAFEGLTPEEVDAYKKANHDAVVNSVIPAYENVISVFGELKNTGKNDGGLCNLPNGKDFYALKLRRMTGSDKTPEEVITLLDNKFDELVGEISILYAEDSEGVGKYMSGTGSKYETFTDYVAVVNRIHEAAKDRFPAMPDVEFTTTPVHKSLEEITSPAFYMTPALDSYTKNSIYVNEKSVDNESLWSTLAHEGVPGHMYQFTYYLNTKPEPIRALLSFNGYTEGWATYAEHLSFEMYDKYEADCFADLSRIDNLLVLIISARTEIGVNYEGWTVEDVEKYLSEKGMNAAAASGLYEYVVKEPVNYQMYVLGYLEFMELREYAESALGSDFDEAEFHKVILDAGPSQFYLLRERVEKYVEEK